MKPTSYAQRLRKPSRFRIVEITAAQRDQKLHDATATRAFELWEGRNAERGTQLEDWRRAESEVLRPLNCGYLVLADKIELSTDTSPFREGQIEICVEPRRLTICGNEPIVEGTDPNSPDCKRKDRPIFRSIDLPASINSSQIVARFHGPTLLITLPTACASEEGAVQKHAA